MLFKTRFLYLGFPVILLVFTSCQSRVNEHSADETTIDHHSYAAPDAVIKHLELDLRVDFASKKLSGTAAYDIQVKEEADSIILDVKGIDIQKVVVDDHEVSYSLGEEQAWLGQPLRIPVANDSKRIAIQYSTRPEAEALQWLQPSQTAGKQHPYLFTQGQAILTRTWIPIQDSPGIRLTYNATIRVPSELMAVMSATNPQERNAEGVYRFEMKNPIPAYLMALAVGDIEFNAIGHRTGVYSEPSVVNAAAAEFVDMEKMLEAAEALYGPYRWDRYDVIVLPPSFPFGGMENPKLTFATPTIIAGDRSLVALIAHEMAHSWSGNLVTNATWNDFWLNEGFTVYFELRIMEALYGKDYTDMLRHLGYQGLHNTIKELDPKDTHLYLDLLGRDPDDAMTDVAYEKGAHFLILLEEKTGREKFDAFLKKYFADHQFQSMTTDRFVDYLKTNLIEPLQLDVNMDEWIYGPGLPADCPIVQVARFENVEAQLNAYISGTPAAQLPATNWSTHEWLHFIGQLPDSLDDVKTKELDTAFEFTTSGNREIQAAWYAFAIKQGYGKQILPQIKTFLVEVGRRKFLMPIYTALLNAGMKEEAKSIFEVARNNYHSVSYLSVSDLLNKSES